MPPSPLDQILQIVTEISAKVDQVILTQAQHTSALAEIQGTLTNIVTNGSFLTEDREALLEALEILKQSEEPDYVG